MIPMLMVLVSGAVAGPAPTVELGLTVGGTPKVFTRDVELGLRVAWRPAPAFALDLEVAWSPNLGEVAWTRATRQIAYDNQLQPDLEHQALLFELRPMLLPVRAHTATGAGGFDTELYLAPGAALRRMHPHEEEVATGVEARPRWDGGRYGRCEGATHPSAGAACRGHGEQLVVPDTSGCGRGGTRSGQSDDQNTGPSRPRPASGRREGF